MSLHFGQFYECIQSSSNQNNMSRRGLNILKGFHDVELNRAFQSVIFSLILRRIVHSSRIRNIYGRLNNFYSQSNTERTRRVVVYIFILSSKLFFFQTLQIT